MFSCVQLFAPPRTVAHQAPLPMEFFRQEHRSRVPFCSTGDLPNPRIKLEFLTSPALAGGFFFFFFYHCISLTKPYLPTLAYIRHVIFFLLSNFIISKIWPHLYPWIIFSLSLQILLELLHLNEYPLIVLVEGFFLVILLLFILSPHIATLIFYGIHWFHASNLTILVLSW